MNLPNSLTVLRIFFVPLLLAVLLRGGPALETPWGTAVPMDWLALVIFLSAAGTDLLDGYLARRRKQVTRFGKLFDPIADKLLISAAFITLVELGRVPAWMVVIIVGREFAVSGLRSVAAGEGKIISASELGKIKMSTQVAAVALLLVQPYSAVFDILADVALWGAVAFTLVSAADYFRCYWMRRAPSESRLKAADLMAALPKSRKEDLAT